MTPRQRWRELSRAFRDAAARDDGQPFDQLTQVRLRDHLKRCRRDRHPPSTVQAAQHAGDALLAASEAFMVAHGPARALCGRMISAAADAFDHLMDAEGQAVADRTWRRHLAEE